MTIAACIIAFVQVYVLFISSCTMTTGLHEERNLLNHLFQNYNTQARPVFEHWNPVEIKFGIRQVTLENVDLKRQTVTVGIWARIMWKDEYLAWDQTQFQNVSAITVDTEKIWLPNLAFGNYLRPMEFLLSGYIGRATVRRNGQVTLWQNLEVTFGIGALITSYPFDTQECTCFVYPRAYPIEQVRIHIMPGKLSTDLFAMNGEWGTENVHVVNYTVEFGTTQYDYIELSFKLRRKWLYYLINVIGPIVLTSILNIVCFQLPPDSGERVTLSISIFLTLAVFQNIVNSVLPESSDGLSVLVIYIGLQLMGSVLTIVITVLILKLYYKNGQISLPCMFVRFTSMARQENAQTDTMANTKAMGPEIIETCTTNRKTCFVTWKRISEILNTFCFIMAILWNFGLISTFWFAL